jgi:hypothetical protein
MTRRTIAAALAVLLCTAVLVHTEAASARRTPTISMSALHTHLLEGQQPQFRYTTSGLPAGSVVQFQRIFDTTWHTIKNIPPGTNRTVTGGPLPDKGQYFYRIQAVKNGALVARTAHNQTIYVYGNVSITAICPNMTGTQVCAKNVTDVGTGTPLTTYMAIGSAVHPNFFLGASLPRTSCTKAHLTFTNKKNSTVKTWLKIHQTTDQVADDGNGDGFGTLDATVISGPFYLDASTSPTSESTYVGGTMLCWTATGTY